jgi:hypothetical protein
LLSVLENQGHPQKAHGKPGGVPVAIPVAGFGLSRCRCGVPIAKPHRYGSSIVAGGFDGERFERLELR